MCFLHQLNGHSFLRASWELYESSDEFLSLSNFSYLTVAMSQNQVHCLPKWHFWVSEAHIVQLKCLKSDYVDQKCCFGRRFTLIRHSESTSFCSYVAL